MNNRFTEQAQQVIQHAHEILQQKQHTQLDNEHIPACVAHAAG